MNEALAAIDDGSAYMLFCLGLAAVAAAVLLTAMFLGLAIRHAVRSLREWGARNLGAKR
jgi:hypothetical protein